MENYNVGQKIDKFVGLAEGVQFDIADDGATLIVFFDNPSDYETSQFKSGVNFEIRFNLMYDIIVITVKIGNLNWMDAPYTPHLSKNLTKFELPSDNLGLALTLILVDCATGEIKFIRLMGLSEGFTKKLFGVVMEQKVKEFDILEYKNNLKKALSYSTKQIVGMSRDYCKINT